MNIQDYIGKTYGMLTVIGAAFEKSPYHVLCQCSCGRQKVVYLHSITNGYIKSCGCLLKEGNRQKRFEDLTGQRFGKLVVVGLTDDYVSPKGLHQFRWSCLCDCGKTTIATTTVLKRNKKLSCGCLRNEKSKTRIKDIAGQRYGSLVAIERVGISSDGSTSLWRCRCDCGKETVVRLCHLTSGTTTTCGDSIHHQLHGDAGSSLYAAWTCMKQRCYNPKGSSYSAYGGRGITVCDEWKDNYIAFRDWAIDNGYKYEPLPNGKNKWSLDRINVNGNYEPTNCRWADEITQARNKQNTVYLDFRGEKLTLHDLAERCGLKYSVVLGRYHQGWDAERIISTPVKKKKEQAND